MDAGLIERIGNNFNAVISDMAPKTTGQKAVDAARSHELCQAAWDIARDMLDPGGNFVCKIFQSQDSQSLIGRVKTHFTEQKLYKPDSSRKASREIYLIGKRKKN